MKTNPILKRKIDRRLKLEGIDATLGDDNGVVFDNPVLRPADVRVRYTTAAGMSLPPVVRVGPSFYAPLKPGKAVKLRYDETGELCVWEPNIAGQLAVGDNPMDNLPNPTGKNNFNTSEIVPLKGYTTSPPSSKVVIKSLLSINGKIVSLFNGAQIDLSTPVNYFPAAGNHRLVGVFKKPDGTLEASASTTQTLPEPLDLTDLQECLTGSSIGSTLAWVWHLQDGQATVSDADTWLDPRQYINIPLAAGTLTVAVRVVTVAGAVTVATSDYVVVVNKTVGAATTVNLPASPSSGDSYVIKDGKGDAAANNITLTPAAGNIDGAGTYVMATNYQSARIVYNGTQWNVI